MSILRPMPMMPHMQFMMPQMPFASDQNPIATAQAMAQAEAQRAVKQNGGLGDGSVFSPQTMGVQTTGQGSAPMPTPAAPSPAGSPASAAAPDAAGGGGMMSSIMKLFGGGGQGGGMDIAKLLAMLG